MTAAENLERLGLSIPEPPKAFGNYVTWIRSGSLFVTSGQLPWENGVMRYPGRLGEQVSTGEGYQASRIAGLNAIAQLFAATRDLERVVRLLRLEGNVHCAPGFRDHPQVLNGASDLFVEVFEQRGLHTRTAVGIPDMPLNACVQLSVWAELGN